MIKIALTGHSLSSHTTQHRHVYMCMRKQNMHANVYTRMYEVMYARIGRHIYAHIIPSVCSSSCEIQGSVRVLAGRGGG